VPGLIAILAAVLMLAACGDLPTPTPSPAVTPDAQPPESPALETPTLETPTSATREPLGDDCLAGSPFVEEGIVPLNVPEVGDAREVRDLRWAAHEGCERFVIDLAAADGSPADVVGMMRAEVLRDLGIVRISLIDTEGVDQEAIDASFDGPLARAAYAVVAPDGAGIYVDLHLAQAAEAHVALLEEPARVVVDLRPSGGPVPAPPAVGDRVVVLQPSRLATTYPLEVVGYARTFEANVVVRIEHQGEEVLEEPTTATAWTDAWGHYSLTIADGPSGRIQLHVGEYSARDGTWEGAAVELELAP
jgi:hypothetical protein